MVFAKGIWDLAREVSQAILPYMRSSLFPCQYSDKSIPQKHNACETCVQLPTYPNHRENICKSSRKPSTPLALQAMGGDIASAFDGRFLLQICHRERSRCCSRKKSEFFHEYVIFGYKLWKTHMSTYFWFRVCTDVYIYIYACICGFTVAWPIPFEYLDPLRYKASSLQASRSALNSKQSRGFRA